jgi:hypothetical protein
MIQHPLPKEVLEQLWQLRIRDEKIQRQLRLGKTPYQHKREHKTLDTWIDDTDT